MIDPPQGYLGNWNNLPSVGWTNGDASAQETNEGNLHRGAFLQQALRESTDRSLAGLKAIERRIGTTAQQRSLLAVRLQDAQTAATGPARTVLDTIVAWDGNYDRTDANGTIDPGVAAFEALKEAVEDTLPAAAVTLLGQRGGSHPYDMGAAEVAGFHSLVDRRARERGRRGAEGAGAAASATPTRRAGATRASSTRSRSRASPPRRGWSSSTAGRSRRRSSSVRSYGPSSRPAPGRLAVSAEKIPRVARSV